MNKWPAINKGTPVAPTSKFLIGKLAFDQLFDSGRGQLISHFIFLQT